MFADIVHEAAVDAQPMSRRREADAGPRSSGPDGRARDVTTSSARFSDGWSERLQVEATWARTFTASPRGMAGDRSAPRRSKPRTSSSAVSSGLRIPFKNISDLTSDEGRSDGESRRRCRHLQPRCARAAVGRADPQSQGVLDKLGIKLGDARVRAGRPPSSGSARRAHGGGSKTCASARSRAAAT